MRSFSSGSNSPRLDRLQTLPVRERGRVPEPGQLPHLLLGRVDQDEESRRAVVSTRRSRCFVSRKQLPERQWCFTTRPWRSSSRGQSGCSGTGNRKGRSIRPARSSTRVSRRRATFRVQPCCRVVESSCFGVGLTDLPLVMQWLRARFNEVCEKVEWAKQHCAEDLPWVDKLVHDRARDLVSDVPHTPESVPGEPELLTLLLRGAKLRAPSCGGNTQSLSRGTRTPSGCSSPCWMRSCTRPEWCQRTRRRAWRRVSAEQVSDRFG
jgi:hypothetical protein